MKKQLLLLFAIFILITACKKGNNDGPTGTGDLTATATMNILTVNVWWLVNIYTAQNAPPQVQFFATNTHGQYGGELNFGQPSPLGPPGFTTATADSFNIYINNGITYLTVTDNVAAISLTNFSTTYQISAISSSGFTLIPVYQARSAAPSFPAIGLTYKKP